MASIGYVEDDEQETSLSKRLRGDGQSAGRSPLPWTLIEELREYTFKHRENVNTLLRFRTP